MTFPDQSTAPAAPITNTNHRLTIRPHRPNLESPRSSLFIRFGGHFCLTLGINFCYLQHIIFHYISSFSFTSHYFPIHLIIYFVFCFAASNVELFKTSPDHKNKTIPHTYLNLSFYHVSLVNVFKGILNPSVSTTMYKFIINSKHVISIHVTCLSAVFLWIILR